MGAHKQSHMPCMLSAQDNFSQACIMTQSECRACVGRVAEGEVDMTDVSWRPTPDRAVIAHLTIFGARDPIVWFVPA